MLADILLSNIVLRESMKSLRFSILDYALCKLPEVKTKEIIDQIKALYLLFRSPPIPGL